MNLPEKYLQMLSTATSEGQLKLELVEKDIPQPKKDQVVIRIEAAPINPSDLGVMFGVANMSKATTTGSGTDSVLSATIPKWGKAFFKGRMDIPLPVGNEGAGTVVAAGEDVKNLLGKVVAVTGGMLYGEYCCAPALACVPLKEGHSAKDGASAFVNPMTALAMVETLRADKHRALIHTAAASNLGQMLNRICLADDVALINIVRKEEQAKLLKDIGAKYVINSHSESFMPELVEAIAKTNATLAFDATGGGELADAILTAMEMALLRDADAYSLYGALQYKQVYLYGGLDPSPTVLNRHYGMHWGVGGFLLPSFLAKAAPEVVGRMRQRVSDELTTTFKSTYTDELSLVDVLQADTMKRYLAKKTGEKFLVIPNKP